MARNHARSLDRPHLVFQYDATIIPANEFSFPVPPRTHWELLSLYVQFTTDANAGNRQFRVETGSAAGTITFAAVINTNLTASTAYSMYWGRGMGYFNNLFTAGHMTNNWPAGMLIPGTHVIRSVTDGVQVGDQINMVEIIAQQWQDPVIL